MGGSIESLSEGAEIFREPVESADSLDHADVLWSKSTHRRGATLEFNPLPHLIIGSERGLRFHVGLSAFISFAILWVGGSMLWSLLKDLVDSRVGVEVGLTTMPTDGLSSSGAIYGFMFATVMTISTLLFALGNGLGYGLTGRPMTDFGLHLSGWSRASDPASTSYRAIIPPLTSGIAQIIFGLSGLFILGGLGWSALQVGFLLAAAFGALNFLLPLGRNSSGGKFWYHLGRITIGRGNRPLVHREELA